MADRAGWTPLGALRERFTANINALAKRYPQLAAEMSAFLPLENYFILPGVDHILLGAEDGSGIRALAHPVSPKTARILTDKLCPDSKCSTPLAIAGEDLGWLWNYVYAVRCEMEIAPGHRPPLFLLMRNLERLWVILHIQEWKVLLADPRVQLFTGPSAFEDFKISLQENAMCPWPKISITVDEGLWPRGVSLDMVLAEAMLKTNEKLQKVKQQLTMIYAGLTPEVLSGKLEQCSPLRVLGVTSRYTTFLQFSMRDWLAAFEKLGHQTKLMIESFDHEAPNSLATAKMLAEFKPDLVVMIDHFRGEHGDFVGQVPFVMWVQDRLPNIYCRSAGEKQQRMDYCIGYSRSELTERFDYPVSRFMPAMMAVNPGRFTPKPLTHAELERYRCDVSFVTTCTAPAERIIHEEMQKQGAAGKRLLDLIFQRFRAVYEAGGWLSSGTVMRRLINTCVQESQLQADVDNLLQLFVQRVNNALFRHQAVRWVAELGVDLHLYGKGWENHPEFARYAKGAADNMEALPAIYRASQINLQVTPHGAVHQRLLDGLAGGGFFLLRSVTADELEILMRSMWEWCQRKGICNAADILERRDDELTQLAQRFEELEGTNPLDDAAYYLSGMEECAMAGFTRTPNTLWNQSERVTFSTREELQSRVRHFLKSPDERSTIVGEMRERVLETHTYESITRRMLRFIAGDIAGLSQSMKVAA